MIQKIERLADLFRQREKLDAEISSVLADQNSSASPAEETEQVKGRQKRKYRKRKTNSDELEPAKEAKKRGRPAKEKIKDVYRYHCLDCDHKWTSFNNPQGEDRDACPECGSKTVEW